MAKRDPVETRKKLLDAALDEFATNGLAGARIDRIAATAGISKPMLYVYFGDKEALFDAVLMREVMDAAEVDQFDAEDLEGYAGRTYDLLVERPRLWRLLTWFHLERGQDILLHPTGHALLSTKLSAIAAVQARGIITPRFEPLQVVRLVTVLTQMWCMAPAARDQEEHDARRTTVQRAVAKLLLV